MRHARAVGFGSREVKRLVSLWQDQQRTAKEVKDLATAHLLEVQAKVAELQLIAGTLAHLIDHCHGDHRPDCPILSGLVESHTSFRAE